MKTLALHLLLIFTLSCYAIPARASDVVDNHLMKQVADIIIECQKITPGMSRADLLKVFTYEGGISAGLNRTFVCRSCPYIKVDVEFKIGDPKKPLEERPTDTITNISKPYLEFAIVD